MQKTETEEFQDVKKAMCFTPVDDAAEMEFRAMKVRNTFRGMGFTRATFMDEVYEALPDYNSIYGYKTLSAFWALRFFGKELIEKLEVLADNLKEEA